VNTSKPGRVRLLASSFVMSWRAHPGALGGQLIVAVVVGVLPVASAWLMREILDALSSSPSRGDLAELVVALGACGCLIAVLSEAGQYLSAQSGRALQREATGAVYGAVARMSGLRRLEDPSYQNRLILAQQAGSSGPGQVVSSVLTLAQAALTLAGFLAALLVLNPLLSGILLAATGPAFYAELGISRRRVAAMDRTSHAQRRQYFYESLLTDVAAAKEIRLFGLGQFFRRRMLAELSSAQRLAERLDRRQLAVYTGLSTASGLVAAWGLWWAAFAALSGRLTIGDLSIFVAALAAVTSMLISMISTGGAIHQALLMFGGYQEVVRAGPDLPVRAEPRPVPPLRSGISIEDVWFRYGPDNPWILRGVTCFIPHGLSVAFVGRNGAGKSTLIKLLCRFYDPDRGRILWDGIDLRDVDPAALRERMSVVFQDYVAYELSVADNLAVGDLQLADDRAALHRAARQAGIHEVLTALPDGYDTLLTRAFYTRSEEHSPRTGVLLSGGQWQRLALARAFMRTSRDLVILDEPSSGLDAEAEYEIHSGLHGIRGGRTTVLISHRLNTIRDADQIVVLADGVVSEQGDHRALMAFSGTYARLFSLQAAGYVGELPEAAQAASGSAV
jgi:ATP-binding cassette, subfamily B, bacterial